MTEFTLGERIRHVRKELKLNQAQFAAGIGIKSATSVSKYEDNLRRPGERVLQAIARLGNIPVDELLAENGGAPTPKRPENEVRLPVRGASLIPGTGKTKLRVADVLAMCSHVLESGTTYASALSLNIQHFHRAVFTDRAHATIEKKLHEIERRNERLESKTKKDLEEMENLLLTALAKLGDPGPQADE